VGQREGHCAPEALDGEEVNDAVLIIVMDGCEIADVYGEIETN
jgi:hypothetical protein